MTPQPVSALAHVLQANFYSMPFYKTLSSSGQVRIFKIKLNYTIKKLLQNTVTCYIENIYSVI